MDEMRELLGEVESECRNQLVRLRLSGEVDGPEYTHWAQWQQKLATYLARPIFQPAEPEEDGGSYAEYMHAKAGALLALRVDAEQN